MVVLSEGVDRPAQFVAVCDERWPLGLKRPDKARVDVVVLSDQWTARLPKAWKCDMGPGAQIASSTGRDEEDQVWSGQVADPCKPFGNPLRSDCAGSGLASHDMA